MLGLVVVCVVGMVRVRVRVVLSVRRCSFMKVCFVVVIILIVCGCLCGVVMSLFSF